MDIKSLLRRASQYGVAGLLLIGFMTACHQRGKPTVSLDKRIGWFHGSCLAIFDPKLPRGTAIELVVMGTPQSVLAGQVGQEVSSAASCAPLIEGRRSQNAKPPTTFYGIEGTKLSATDMGIGVVGPPQKPAIVNGLAQADLNSDGQPEVFSSCATTEGINFSISTGKPFAGTPLWSGYYYLGYDMTPTCP